METKITKRAAFLIAFDLVAGVLAYVLSSVLTGQSDTIMTSTDILFIFGGFALVNVVIMAVFHLYSGLWEFASTDEMAQIVIAVFLGSIIGAIGFWILDVRLPIRVYLVAALLVLLLSGGVRFAYRYGYGVAKVRRERAPQHERPRTMVVGAGETGSMTIKRMISGDYAMQGIPILAIDDDPKKQGLRIHGVKVMGTRDDIMHMVEAYSISQIVVALPAASKEDRRAIFTICSQTNCKLLTLPDVRSIRVGELDQVVLREVNLADLLGRQEIVLDTRLVSSYVAGRTVLVTGAGGSIGSELVRQLAPVGPSKIVLFDIYENGVFELKTELKEAYGDDLVLNIEIGSVRDKSRLTEIFELYHPEVVFHAAAHKHVPLMEACPREAIKNNVFGTYYLAKTAHEFKVNNFIFISTDKAVNPANIMGATKRMGEMIIQALAKESDTVFTAVRFGNVLGSNGSVIPIFKRQIKEGGPLTVTHPDITRFFMTIPEAARLVIEAGGLARGGEIFILDMGEPVKIVDLARNLINLSGLEEGKDIEIAFTGLRPGEKLYEELLMDTETTIDTSVRSIMVSMGKAPHRSDVRKSLDLLKEAIHQDDDAAKEALLKAVPTYRPAAQ